jgi:hypothetical protein
MGFIDQMALWIKNMVATMWTATKAIFRTGKAITFWATGLFIHTVGQSSFLFVLSGIAAVLWMVGVISLSVFCTIAASCVVTFFIVSRSPYVKNLPGLWRLLVRLIIAGLLVWGGMWFSDWAIEQYHQNRREAKQPESKQEPTPKTEQPKQPMVSNVAPEVQVKLIFKDSPLFTPKRKQQITAEIDAFRKYLIGLGFDVPKETPPIGTYSGKGFQGGYSGSLGNNLPFNADIYIGDEAIDDPTSWRRAYAYYFFTVIFDRHSQKDAGLKFRKEWIIHIFLDYFANSYSNKRPKFAKGIDEWVNALWDIRDSCGQDFTDRALFYTSEVKIEAEEKIEKNFKNFEKDFNKDFSLRFLEGAWVVDNNLQNRPKIGEILRRHNLL